MYLYLWCIFSNQFTIIKYCKEFFEFFIKESEIFVNHYVLGGFLKSVAEDFIKNSTKFQTVIGFFRIFLQKNSSENYGFIVVKKYEN